MKRFFVLAAAAALLVGVSVPAAAVTHGTQPFDPVVEPTTLARSVQQDVELQLSQAATDIRAGFAGEAKPAPEPVYASGAYYGPVPVEFTGMFAVWPVPGGVLHDGFGYRDGGEFHSGIDILAPGGTPIIAAADGVVIRIDADGGLGQYVMVDHGSGIVAGYAHMIAGSPVVAPGQFVSAGEMLGLVGDTGYATTTHLHFLVEYGGARTDPMPFFG